MSNPYSKYSSAPPSRRSVPQATAASQAVAVPPSRQCVSQPTAASLCGQSVLQAVATPPSRQNAPQATVPSSRVHPSSSAYTASGGATPGQGLVHPDVQLWKELVTHWYPKMEERTYFVPSVHMNRVRYDTHVVGRQTVHVPQPPVADRRPGDQSVSESDARDDRTTQRLLACLRALADKLAGKQREVMFVLSQLNFGDYLGEPIYSAAASLFPRPLDLKKKKKKGKKKSQKQGADLDEGDFDILLILREFGLLVAEVKTVGDLFSSLNLTQQEEDDIVAKTVQKAIKQLIKADTVLTHIVSDLQPSPRVLKTLILPNVSRSQLQRVLQNNPQLQQDLCQCLSTHSGTDSVDMCLCADNLTDTATPYDVTDDVMTALLQWWGHIVTTAGPDPSFKTHYLSVVARFAGPATTVQVFCESQPRLHLHTEMEAVSHTGRCFTHIVFHPDQLDILHQNLPRVFLCAAPGTGKTIVLVLKSVMWLEDGHDVIIVSARGHHSLAASHMIDDQVRQMAGPLAQHKLHLHPTDVEKKDQMTNTLQDLLARVDTKGGLYVICDETATTMTSLLLVTDTAFSSFCDSLHSQVPNLHMWAAACHGRHLPSCLTKVTLSEPLRSPPVLVRQIAQSVQFTSRRCPQYRESPAPLPTDGPPVRYIHHTPHGEGHGESQPGECRQCGVDVARLLCTDLRVGDTGHTTASSTVSPEPLVYKDVLVVSKDYSFTDDVTDVIGKVVRPASDFVQGLRQGGVPVRVVQRDDVTALAEMAVMGGADAVNVMENCEVIGGLERKVVVLVEHSYKLRIESYADPTFDLVSRCTSQLINVSRV